MHRLLGPTESGPWTLQTAQILIRTIEGHLAVAEEVNHEEQVELVYDPPLVVALAAETPDTPPFEQSTRLRVHPMGDRQSTKAQGKVTQKIDIASAEALGDPNIAEPVRTRTQHFTAGLPPAQVINVTVQWLAADGQVLAETREERTKVMGLQTRNNRESWRLVSGPR